MQLRRTLKFLLLLWLRLREILVDPSFGGKVKPARGLERIESSPAIDPNVLGKDLPAPIRDLMKALKNRRQI